MKEEKRLKNNGLIGMFIKSIPIPESNRILEIDEIATVKLNVDCFRFHDQWDWLMPVLDNIEELGYQIDILSRFLPDRVHKDYTCIIWNKDQTIKVLEITGEVRIQVVYDSVIEFINYFRQSKIY